MKWKKYLGPKWHLSSFGPNATLVCLQQLVVLDDVGLGVGTGDGMWCGLIDSFALRFTFSSFNSNSNKHNLLIVSPGKQDFCRSSGPFPNLLVFTSVKLGAFGIPHLGYFCLHIFLMCALWTFRTFYFLVGVYFVYHSFHSFALECQTQLFI